MSGSHETPENSWEGDAPVGEYAPGQSVPGDHHGTDRHSRPRRAETDRQHPASRHPEGDRRQKARRSEGDRQTKLVRPSLDEILERNPQADRRRVQRSPRAQLFVTICHWSMTFLLALNLLSGMRMSWGYEESAFGGLRGTWSNVLATVSPGATMFGINIITLHVWSSFVMLLITGVYVGYLVRSRTSRKLSVTRSDLRKLVHGIRSGDFLRNKAALWSANVLVYWISFAFIGMLAVTGVALYRLDLGLSTMLGGYDVTRLVHGIVGYLLIPYTILHATLQWLFGRFWTIFKAHAWRKHVLAGALGLLIALPIAAGAYFLDDLTETLSVPHVAMSAVPVLDGDANDAVWASATPVTIRTAKGTNSPDTISDVTVRAVHDGKHVYFSFQWTDADVSFKRYPLQKTEAGWKVLQTAFENADENTYYEDKLSMYVTKVRNGSCASTCHLGDGPSAAKGDKHGLHYTTGGEYGDVWHWKSVRTNNMADLAGEPGYTDDQYFGPKTPIKPGRYTGGYYADPDQGGGYDYNFTKLDPKKPLKDTYVVPKFLPHNGDAVHTDATANTHELGKTWWLLKGQAMPYTKEADTYPVGTLIPNIVIQPLTGDRADVRARAAWKDGRWTLETRRVLDTGSKYDVPFVPGEPVYITVATYNRVQTRHGEHIKPVRVVVEP
jgi:thiosulfate reductase cytochrome b subunit